MGTGSLAQLAICRIKAAVRSPLSVMVISPTNARKGREGDKLILQNA